MTDPVQYLDEDHDDYEALQDRYSGPIPLTGPLNDVFDLEPLRTYVCPDCHIERSCSGNCFCD